MVMFTISSTMSSTYNNARLAALDFEDVYAVDTCNLSTGGGLLVLHAAEMAAAGKSAAEIAEECRAMTDKVDASFVIDNLEFLHKGGRCSALAALGANLLQLKPCISVNGGKMGVGKKYRGSVMELLEPNHSGAFYPSYIENANFDEDFAKHVMSCSKNCEECSYCADVMKRASVTLAADPSAKV